MVHILWSYFDLNIYLPRGREVDILSCELLVHLVNSVTIYSEYKFLCIW